MNDAENVVVVSMDTHVGPRLVEDLRSYCPKGLLDDVDDFARIPVRSDRLELTSPGAFRIPRQLSRRQQGCIPRTD
jgi:hypothetical protein